MPVKKAISRLASAWLRRRAVLVPAPNSGDIYVIAPEGLANLLGKHDWADIYDGGKGQDEAHKLFRQWGGGILHNGEGEFNVIIPHQLGYFQGLEYAPLGDPIYGPSSVKETEVLMQEAFDEKTGKRAAQRVAKRYLVRDLNKDILPDEATFLRRIGPNDAYQAGDWVYLVDRSTKKVIQREMSRRAKTVRRVAVAWANRQAAMQFRKYKSQGEREWKDISRSSSMDDGDLIQRLIGYIEKEEPERAYALAAAAYKSGKRFKHLDLPGVMTYLKEAVEEERGDYRDLLRDLQRTFDQHYAMFLV